MKLMTKELERKMPALYSTEGQEEKLAKVKFFTPWSNFTWYGCEYNPIERLFFGLFVGRETEYCYFSLDELESLRGPFGLRVERDMHFTPKPVEQFAGC